MKSTNFKHNVYLQDAGDGKVVILCVVDKEALGLLEIPSQAFCMATTMINAYTGLNPSVQLNIRELMPADEWGKTCGDEDIMQGRGVSGILKSAVWFCQRVADPFFGLLG